MWRVGSGRDGTVTCIACGEGLARGEAREYDKYGDPWDREDKSFEYLCRDCDRSLCHQPRDDLEDLLVEGSAGEVGDGSFLQWYCATVEERYGPVEEQ